MRRLRHSCSACCRITSKCRRFANLAASSSVGGSIRLLEYTRPTGTVRRIVSRLWQPWIGWAYGASFDRQTERHVPAAGLVLVESRYVVDDLVKLLTLRTPN